MRTPCLWLKYHLDSLEYQVGLMDEAGCLNSCLIVPVLRDGMDSSLSTKIPSGIAS